MATPSTNGKINVAVLVWPVIYLVLLVALPIIRNAIGSSLPHYVLYPLGGMPLSVLWFGALGGVLASLYGMLTNRDWQNPFNLSYAFSGLLGAVYGLISYLIIVVLINATTISNSFSRTSLAFDLVALLFGLRQYVFMGVFKRTGRFGNGGGRNTEV